MHISSSYAKILGEKLFHTWEIPRSGSKAEDGEKKEKKREKKLNDGNNNGQATHGARKPSGPISHCFDQLSGLRVSNTVGRSKVKDNGES